MCCSKQSRRRGVLSSSLFPSLSISSFNGSNCVEKRGSPGSKAWSTLVPCHAELQSDGERQKKRRGIRWKENDEGEAVRTMKQSWNEISQDSSFDVCTTLCTSSAWKRGKAGNVDRKKQARLVIFM